MAEQEQREDFEIYTSFMECIIRYFWRHGQQDDRLEAERNHDITALFDALHLIEPFHITFNNAAHEDAAGKTVS